MDSATRELLIRLTLLLDAALPLLDKEAATEARREAAGKAPREITAQERAKAVRETLVEATKVLTR